MTNMNTRALIVYLILLLVATASCKKGGEPEPIQPSNIPSSIIPDSTNDDFTMEFNRGGFLFRYSINYIWHTVIVGDVPQYKEHIKLIQGDTLCVSICNGYEYVITDSNNLEIGVPMVSKEFKYRLLHGNEVVYDLMIPPFQGRDGYPIGYIYQ